MRSMLPVHANKPKNNRSLLKKRSSLSSNLPRKTSQRPHSLTDLWSLGSAVQKSPQQRLLSNKDVANIKKTKQTKKKKTSTKKGKRSQNYHLIYRAGDIILPHLFYGRACQRRWLYRCSVREMLVKKRRRAVKSRLSSQGNKSGGGRAKHAAAPRAPYCLYKGSRVPLCVVLLQCVL